MNILILLSLFAAVSNPLFQKTEPLQKQRSHSVYFEWNRWQIESDTQRTELAKIIDAIANHPDAAISIDGWTDRTGTIDINRSMSMRRAESVRNHLIAAGVAAERMMLFDHGVDSLAADEVSARRVDITLILEVEPVVAEVADPVAEQVQPEAEPLVEEVLEPEPVVETVQRQPEPEPQPEPQSGMEWLKMFSLRTDVLYWLGGMPNVGAEWSATREIGVLLNVGWAPWSSNGWEHNWATWFVSPEVRWYFGAGEGWFAGVQFLGGAYNFKPKDKGVQGSILGGGLLGGYKMPLWGGFSADFTLGVGFAHLKYDRYRRADNGINVITERGVVKNTVVPLQAGVNLIWNF